MVIFNPNKLQNHMLKKRESMIAYLEKPIVKGSTKTRNIVGIGMQRELDYFFIKHRMFLMLNIMGKMRKWQKEHK